jgi:protein-S-isoprenylcysteine O-methyltransferase Ste14
MSASPPSAAPPPSAKQSKPFDLINRGVKRSTPLGTTLFVGLRALDPLLQYGILAHGIGSTLLSKLGISQLPPGLATRTGTFIDKLGLSPYRMIILAMAAGSSIKQIYWLLCTSEEEFPPSAALPVVVYNTLFNSINTLAFTTTLASASLSSNETFPQTPLLVGSALYIIGILTEAIAETQRRNFKREPKNKGKVYSGGLWSIARHINYTGYSMWRAGYTLAASGWGAGVFVVGYLLADFNFRAIRVLDGYCAQRVSFVPAIECFRERFANYRGSMVHNGRSIRGRRLISLFRGFFDWPVAHEPCVKKGSCKHSDDE